MRRLGGLEARCPATWEFSTAYGLSRERLLRTLRGPNLGGRECVEIPDPYVENGVG